MGHHEIATGSEIAPTDRSYWVVPDLFAAGAYPGKRYRDEPNRKVEALVAAGITAFVNLTEDRIPGSQDRGLNEYDVDALRLGADVRIVRMPIVDISIPTIPEMISILDQIDELLAEEIGTYAHCRGGSGRTGTVVGCWLIRHGFDTPETVLATIKRLRRQNRRTGHRRSPDTDEQDRFVLSWDLGK
jgi:protein-tyrosine phosphatase